MMSMGGFAQPEWSPCSVINCVPNHEHGHGRPDDLGAVPSEAHLFRGGSEKMMIDNTLLKSTKISDF